MLSLRRGTLAGAMLVCASAAVAQSVPTEVDKGPNPPMVDPCANLFALVSRPTVTTSSCAVKPKDALLEFGYVNAATAGSGNSSTLPSAALRVGLSRNLEADALIPTFSRTSAQPVAAGFGDAAAGLKYQFGYSRNSINAVNAFFTGATGAKAFTGGSGGATVSYDVSYALSSKFGLAGTLGYNSFALQGVDSIARRYWSLNPSIVLANSFQKAIQGYVEFYGATASGPRQTGRYCFDGGFQGDLSQHLQLDGSIGTLCTNIVGNSAHYVSFGGAYRL